MPKTYVDVVLVYLLLFVSGSQIYQQSTDKYLVLAFAVTLAAWFVYSDRSINNRFVLYVSCFTGFLLLIHFYTGTSLPFTSVVSSAMKLVMAYLVVRTIGHRFVDTYIRVVVFLAVVSLFGYMSDSFGLLTGLVTKLPRVGNLGYEGVLYLFRFGNHIDRNNSIFYEPGAYQIFLNSALFLLFFTKTGFTVSHRWLYIIALLITLLTTFSTTAFLIFGVMFGLFLFKSTVLSAKGKTLLVAMLVVMVSVFTAQFQHVLFEKIEDYVNIEDITDRSNLRSADILVDLQIFRKNVFGIGYNDYMKAVSSIGKTSEGAASSNGVTRSLAVYGLPFSLFLFGSYYFGIRRLVGPGVMAPVTFVMFLMFLVGQSYYLLAPYTLALIAAAFVYSRPEANSVLFENRRE